ncbi:hypothetical protein [Hymenobacter sp. BRD67]|uniref:hypothetical protein n=1 Tax=Hymenobacter sp. BRD67 TaxID=2675877 RepID=UPI00156544C3|nr:hypothetical protein [Hymenobacter sp. BRD67]QKG54257.1 hypothetical protein GKZ67_18720 [Hymenobacter sp. BRD67]
MPFATRFRLVRSYSLALVLAIAGLASSCQSSRPSFSFQPVPSQTVVASPVSVPVGPTSEPAPEAAPVLTTTAHHMSASARPLRRAAPEAPLRHLAAVVTGHQLMPRPGRKPTTEGAAESGLGRVALFFIGVIAVVLAGLAALVNLIFSVGFFTALGYTAAGLVVLALLYLLVSGKKKKT